MSPTSPKRSNDLRATASHCLRLRERSGFNFSCAAGFFLGAGFFAALFDAPLPAIRLQEPEDLLGDLLAAVLLQEVGRALDPHLLLAPSGSGR